MADQGLFCCHFEVLKKSFIKVYIMLVNKINSVAVMWWLHGLEELITELKTTDRITVL